MPVLVDVRPTVARALGRARVERWAARMLASLRLGRAELSIVLTDDAEIHALNRQHRKKDRPTDVLAFALREGPHAAFAGDALGDVVLSIETARRQARAAGHGLADEATMLLAHGLLHLVGYDHRDDDEERAMTRKTRALVRVARAAEARK